MSDFWAPPPERPSQAAPPGAPHEGPATWPVAQPSATSRPRPAGPPAWRGAVRREVAVAVGLLAAGLVLGGIWALAAPPLAQRADPGETRVAVDGVLGLLGLAAGLVTAAGLAVAGGREPVVRVVAVLAGSTGGALLAVGVGLAAGLRLGAPGLALLWPLVVAVVTAVRLLLSLLTAPEGQDTPGRLQQP